ncbi:hypothetical protein DP107_01305 [Haloglomus irregulare]|uniref:Uncharacterized protein n=1 Tax=Haloglomus irregulare TaxID=2234134 RepID=A0A554NEN5_9EURY|nr:hypothetical protein [Haloglomus irregulare]TSD15849.1 hypothetical protein DP107_01305 [Haloglomus irregulare]
MTTPSTVDGTDDRGGSLTAAFAAGVAVTARRPLLALVPLLAGLTSTGQFERAARADTAFQVNFGLPAPVAGLWTFLNAPSRDGLTAFGTPLGTVRDQPELLATAVLVAVVGLLLVGLLTAVYLGAIDDVLAGRGTDHRDNLRRHAPVTLAFAALELLGIVAVAFGVLGAGRPRAPVLLVPVFLGALVALYLLTPGVYVGVAADLAPLAAFRHGLDIALTGAYLLFALAHAAVVAAVSVPLSALAFSAGLPSLLLGALAAAPAGLALNAATMALVRRQTGRENTGLREPTRGPESVDGSAGPE